MKKSKMFLSVLLALTLVFTMMPMTAQAASANVKIKWDANGGKIGPSKTKTVSYKQGAEIKTLQTAKRTGYTLKGWYTEKKSGGTKITKKTKANKKATFYARWAGNESTLKFDANGGTVSKKSIRVTFGNAYGKLPEPTRSGYKFEGWYTSETGGKKVTAATKAKDTKDITVYARWTQALNSEEKKLIGYWGTWYDGSCRLG